MQVFKNLKYYKVMATGTLVNLKEVTFIHLSKNQQKSFQKIMPMLNEKIGKRNPTLMSKV